ncbi:MAG: hypothetical protein JW720_13790 [Sedimentisphaerales bacterium]|nr:hypothetical protein [Sedimentisphaerales bacterium]
MSRSQTRAQIKGLKQQLRTANRVTDARLLRLALVMVLLAVIAALLYGRIAF